MPDREPSVLNRTIAEHRGEAGGEAALFEEAPAAVAAAAKPVGRPVGSRNLRSEAYAGLLVVRHGEAPNIAVSIAAKNILDSDVVAELVKAWRYSWFEAVKLWAALNRMFNPTSTMSCRARSS
jgi:hypothetical protein